MLLDQLTILTAFVSGQDPRVGRHREDLRCQGACTLRRGLVLHQVRLSRQTHLRQITSRCQDHHKDLRR